MATVTHYIYSHYDPQQRELLERATGQVAETEEPDPWQTESSFGARRRIALAPRFVPAIVSYDEINNMMGVPPAVPDRAEQEPSDDVSSWYRNITRSNSAPVEGQGSPPSASTLVDPSPLADAPPVVSPITAGTSKSASRSKNDWFISRALRSEPPTARPSPTQTLADLLSRDPPPSHREQPFVPPVFLTLGPTNKGFTMLQQSGWNEGEPLGAGVPRRRYIDQQRKPSKNTKREEGFPMVKEEVQEVRLGDDGDISELRKVNVIDLTLSDTEDEREDMTVEETWDPDLHPPRTFTAPTSDNTASHNPRALITPLPTVLKSDRLGIGLKAKTVGPYKESKKRVTHNAAALAAHVRANEEMRRMKKLVGRGTKGFARLSKAESEQRRRLLASLNEGS